MRNGRKRGIHYESILAAGRDGGWNRSVCNGGEKWDTGLHLRRFKGGGVGSSEMVGDLREWERRRREERKVGREGEWGRRGENGKDEARLGSGGKEEGLRMEGGLGARGGFSCWWWRLVST